MKLILNDYKPKEIIKIIREWTECTQEEFSKIVGKSKDTIQSYELGRNKMSLDIFLETLKKENITITIEKGGK